MKYLLLAAIILLILCALFRKKSNEERVAAFYRNPTKELPKLDVYVSNEKVPKIIHQTAPADKSKWHPIWYHCQESWKKNFPNYEYKMWTDEDNENLIKTKYSWFYDTYKGFKHNISRVDSSRYFYLYEYGGIYADMDFECLKNFEHILPNGKVSIAETPYQSNPSEEYQNALMVSPPKHPFWMCLILNMYENRESNDPIIVTVRPVDKTIRENKDVVFTLEYKLFAPEHTEEFKNLHDAPEHQMENINVKTDAYTRHHGTAVWL